MEHPRFRWGHISIVGDGHEVSDLDPSEINRSGNMLPPEIVMRLRKGLVVTKHIRDKEGLLNSRTWLQPVPKSGEGIGATALRETGFWLAKGRRPPHPLRNFARVLRHPIDAANALYFYKGPAEQRLNPQHFCFNSIFEQAPQPNSRVMLTKKLDKLGQRSVAVDWQLDETT